MIRGGSYLEIISVLFLVVILSQQIVQAVPETYERYIIPGVPYIRQKPYWCGPASLAMVLNYWGLNISQDEIATEIYRPDDKLTYISDMVKYPRSLGFYAKAITGSIDILKNYIIADIPLIVLQKFSITNPYGHYRVVIGFDDNEHILYVLDPAIGKQTISYDEFIELWKPGSTFTVTNWTLIIYPRTCSTIITKTLTETEICTSILTYTKTEIFTETEFVGTTITVTSRIQEFTSLSYVLIIFTILIGLLMYLYLIKLRRS